MNSFFHSFSGDTINSYAYDGNRIRRWNVTTHKYGEPWLSGDIIGCALDLDNGVVEFYRNGRSLGKAFEGISTGAGFAYFPTVSLAFTENLTANFGSTPLRYPIEGFSTLQAPPTDYINDALLLFEWLRKLIRLIEIAREKENNETDDEKDAEKSNPLNISCDAFISCLACTVLAKLGPLLAIPYVTEAVFVPFLREISGAGENPAKGADSNRIRICLDLLWTFLEETEMKSCLESTVVYLLSAFRHVSLKLEYPDQCRSLILLTNLSQHAKTRQHLLQNILFDRVRFANFVHVKPLDETGLANVIGNTWWETDPPDPVVEANKKHYLRACESIKNAISGEPFASR